MKRLLLMCVMAVSLLGAEEAVEKKAMAVENQAVKAAKNDTKPDKKLFFATDDGAKRELYLFLPKGWKETDKRPLMMLIHGGGWRGGSAEAFFLQCRDYADAGFVAVSVNYRLADSQMSTPTMFRTLSDAKAAFRYASEHAGELGIDPAKIITSGSSAGAHLSIGIAVLPGFDGQEPLCKPAACVLMSPVVDTTETGYQPTYRRMKEDAVKFSPAHHLGASMPPQLIILGALDHILSAKQAKQYMADVEKQGSQCELELYEGAKHGAFYRGKYYEQCRPRIRKFLENKKLWPEPDKVVTP